MFRLSHSLISTFLLLSFAACTSQAVDEGKGGASSNGGEANAAGEPNAGGGSSAPQFCPEGQNPETESDPILVGVVTGLVVDEQGDPTTAGLVQVCAKNLCLDATPGANGRIAQQQVPAGPMEVPACKIGDGREWGKLAVPVGKGDTDMGSLTAVRLPDYADGVFLKAGEAASSGGVTLSLSADAVVEHDILALDEDSMYGFRAAELPQAALDELAEKFVMAFALAPLETKLCPAPALSIENTKALAPGTELELFIEGLDVSEQWAPYAGWKKVGEGAVSDDGATLEFPEGPPLLTVIGIREKG